MASRVNQVSGHLASRPGLLDGQVAIITGSGQGIGAAAAKIFAREGAKVIVSDIDSVKSNQVAQEIRESGLEAHSIPGDMLDQSFPDQLVKGAVEKYGRVNVLVNNAGFTYDGVIHKMSDEQWNVILECHNTAPFRMVRALSPYWRKKDGEFKSIVNVSSSSGMHGNAGQINYSTAKMGAVGMIKAISKEWGRFGVRANAVSFGFIKTRMTAERENGEMVKVNGQPIHVGIPAKAIKRDDAFFASIPLMRGAAPEEAANAMLILACPLASYVTGQVLEVTGGRDQ